MSDDFVAQYEDSQWTSGVTLQEHLRNLSHITKVYPVSEAEIIDLNVVVDEANGQAEVIMNLETRNSPVGGPNIQHMYVMEWRRRSEEWKCTKYRGVAGMAWPNMVGGTLSQIVEQRGLYREDD